MTTLFRTPPTALASRVDVLRVTYPHGLRETGAFLRLRRDVCGLGALSSCRGVR
jgi:hypothetical protein